MTLIVTLTLTLFRYDPDPYYSCCLHVDPDPQARARWRKLRMAVLAGAARRLSQGGTDGEEAIDAEVSEKSRLLPRF